MSFIVSYMDTQFKMKQLSALPKYFQLRIPEVLMTPLEDSIFVEKETEANPQRRRC